ncbi:MAG TPA: heavy metal translocating P-type ATPase, partial [Chloroflexota bacterium]|nr:heavy metal translocating P-type ATPase [Chloroflexota bacterium]
SSVQSNPDNDRSTARRAEARERRVMAALTVACLVTLGIAWLGTSTGTLPDDVVIALAVVAYLSGGGFATARALGELRHGKLGVDLLMVVAALGAATVGAWAEGGVLLFLFSLSNTLERFALHRTRRAIEALLDLTPPEAVVRRDGAEIRIPIAALVIGDIAIVRPGERIPADGVVVQGSSAVDQSPMTGESIPVEKVAGDPVFAGTLNQQGALEIAVSKRAHDSTLQRIITLVEEAQSEKARSQQFTDWFGQRYTLGVFVVAGLAIVIPWGFLGEPWSAAFYRAMTLLVVASPCAVVISIPAALLSAIARAAHRGMLFKGGAHLERAARIDVVAFDKTGTLTVGHPVLTGVWPAPGSDRATGLRVAASAEARPEHPLAHAVVDGALAEGIDLIPCDSLQAVIGKGIRAELADGTALVGRRALLEESGIAVPPELVILADEQARHGQTTVYVAHAGRVLGVIAAADALRPTARAAIDGLRRLGIGNQIMLTGDNRAVARAIAEGLGIAFEAELLPEDKLRRIQALAAKGRRVAMVGDGINDAPSLATASLGVSLGGNATDVALETADLVLMGDDLRRLPEAIGLARATNRIIRQNIIFAFGVMAFLVVATFVLALRLPFAVVGHEGSTVLVILNGLRLLAYRPPGGGP